MTTETKDVRERRIALEGASNFRDLGDYVTEDGRRVRWRRVFRADALHDLTLADVRKLAGIGLGHVFDLRTDREIEVFGTNPLIEHGVRHHHIPFVTEVGIERNTAAMPLSRLLEDHAAHAERYLDMLELAKPSVHRVLTALVERQDSAAVFHCTGGRDRTGLTAALLLSVLGVPRPVIAADYALTTEYLTFSEERRERMRQLYGVHVIPDGASLMTHAEVMTLTLDGLDERYGSPAAYLVDAGVSEEHQQALCQTLLETTR